jgi:hypothetical protein
MKVSAGGATVLPAKSAIVCEVVAGAAELSESGPTFVVRKNVSV